MQVYDLDDDGKSWGNLPVWGTGDDESEIAGAMQADAELFNERTQQRIDGDRFPFAVRFLDEVPATYERIPEAFEEWAFMMTSRARKRAMIAILMTQFRDPKLNGIKPDQWRTSFTTFYLGFKQVGHALNYLVKPKDLADRLRKKLDQCQRPCLVAFDDGWYWYDVPNLEQWTKDFLAKTKGKINPTSDTQLGLKPTPNEALDDELIAPEILDSIDQAITESQTDYLKRMWQLEFQPTPKIETDYRQTKPLSSSAQSILDKYIEKDMYGTWINAKWVKNFAFRSKELSAFSSEQIRDFLIELAASSIGSVEGEGSDLRWFYDPETESATE